MSLPKAQAYPSTKISIGAVLYVASATTDDARKTSTEIEEWIVRSVRAKRGSKSRFGVSAPGSQTAAQYVNLTRRLDYVTWGKLSSKVGDYGWLKSIPSWCVIQFKVGSDLPAGVYTTPRAALVYAIARAKISIAQTLVYIDKETIPSEISEWKSEMTDLESQISALKRRLAKVKTK